MKYFLLVTLLFSTSTFAMSCKALKNEAEIGKLIKIPNPVMETYELNHNGVRFSVGSVGENVLSIGLKEKGGVFVMASAIKPSKEIPSFVAIDTGETRFMIKCEL